MDLGNNFFLIKFFAIEGCTRVWDERLIFIQCRLLFFKDEKNNLIIHGVGASLTFENMI